MAANDGIRNILDRAGGSIRIAAYLGLRRQAVYQWRKVPIRHVLAVEELSGVPRHEIRPDIYPPPKRRARG